LGKIKRLPAEYVQGSLLFFQLFFGQLLNGTFAHLKKVYIFTNTKKMHFMDWQNYIQTDPEILLGKPIIKGTRLSVEFIIQRLANGWTTGQILENYPQLTKEALQAVFYYVNDCMKDGFFFDNNRKSA
jgi:uncharacterized protein (DUF433 family)